MKKLLLICCLLATAFVLSTTAVFAEEEQKLNTGEQNQLALTSYSAYLSDFNTGRELYSYNADAKHEIASMVKIMTASLVFDAIDEGKINYEDKVTVSEEASGMGGSQMFLDANTQYKVSDLMLGLIIASANDASVALAEHISGSAQAFVDQMNEKANELGMVNTKFANCTGLPSESEQYSTAKDVNIMTRDLIENEKYYEFAKVWTTDFVHPSGRVTTLTNTNKLIRHYQGCLGGKTGYTDSAKFCLSACAMRKGIKTVATVIGADDSKTRFAEVSKLFNYGFTNFKNEVIYKKGESVSQSVKVNKGKVDTITPVTLEEVGILIKQGEKVKVEYEFGDNITAPIQKGDVIGKIKITHEGKEYYFDLVSDQDVPKATIWDLIKDFATKW